MEGKKIMMILKLFFYGFFLQSIGDGIYASDYSYNIHNMVKDSTARLLSLSRDDYGNDPIYEGGTRIGSYHFKGSSCAISFRGTDNYEELERCLSKRKIPCN